MKDLVSTLFCHLDIPVTVKIRKVGTEENTLALARMLQEHGAQVLTIHGRTRHQKQQFTGAVDRAIIRKIKYVALQSTLRPWRDFTSRDPAVGCCSISEADIVRVFSFRLAAAGRSP